MLVTGQYLVGRFEVPIQYLQKYLIEYQVRETDSMNRLSRWALLGGETIGEGDFDRF